MIGDLLRLAGKQRTRRGPAVACRGRILTYDDLNALAGRLIERFRREGARPGDRVAMLLPNCHYNLATYFAALDSGLVLVPLNLRWQANEIREVLGHAGARLLVSDERRLAAIGLSGEPLEEPSEHLPGQSPGDRVGCPAWSICRIAIIDRPPGEATEMKPSAPSIDATHIYYTSGTTGRPKGVILTRGNLLAHVAMTLDELQFSGQDVWLHAAPMFHLADAWAIWTVTAAAGRHVMLPEFDPAAALDLIETEGVTITNLIPAMIPGILVEAERRSARPASLRLLLSGGAPIAPSLVERIETVLGCEYVQTYGLTETSPFLTFSILDEAQRRLPPAEQLRLRARTGRAVKGIELRVVQPAGADIYKDVPSDDATVGEVVVRGETVTPGYWRDEESTRAAFGGGWFHTGDLGTIDHHGSLNLVDRAKDVIITGGESVYSIEVESVLHAHPSIREVAVFGVPDDRWGEAVCAVVVLRDPPTCSDDDLIAFCSGRLASYKCPQRIERYTALPRTGSGKIDKKGLREPFWRGRDRRIN